MGAKTPAASGNDVKPAVKNDGKPSGRNNNRRDNNYNKKEKFLGADPNLRGHVFEAKRNRSEQVANFKVVDDIIRAQVGTECDPYVLESLDTETLTLPDEPDAPKKITIGTGDDEKKVYDKIDRRRLGDWPHIHYLLWQWTVCYVTGYQSEWREIHHAWRTRDGDRKVHGRVLCVWRHD